VSFVLASYYPSQKLRLKMNRNSGCSFEEVYEYNRSWKKVTSPRETAVMWKAKLLGGTGCNLNAVSFPVFLDRIPKVLSTRLSLVFWNGWGR